jgi:hypothetical protein
MGCKRSFGARSAPKGVLAFAVLSLALSASSANAAVIHDYLPAPSEELSKGVPAGAELPGLLGELNAMTVDSGHVWIAEKLPGLETTRVDEFDAATGAFMLQVPQVSGLTGLDGAVAVGHGTPETQVYVGAQEAGAGVVAVFSATGSLLGRWSGADTPATSFAGIEGLALDASSAGGDWAKGDAYVVSGAEPAVDVFKPEAAGTETFQTQIKGTCETTGLAVCAGTVPFARPSRVAVDQTTGDVLVVDGEAVVDVFQPVGLANEYAFVRQLTGTPRGAFARVTGVAVDAGNGDVYVNEGVPTIVDEFNAAGEYVGDLTETPTAGPFKGPASVAVDPISHDVYVGDIGAFAAVDVFGPDLVVPTVATEPATGIEPDSVILHGTLIPEQEGPATCRFAYGTGEELGQTVPCPAAVPAGEAEVPVSVPLTKLTSDTTYFYRLQASNKNGLNPGEASQDRQFTTLGPGIRAESVANVAATSATLQASVDPHERPTSVYFQYATTGSFADAISVPPAPGVAIGSGKEPVEVAPQHVQGLSPGTLYYYRAVALSEVEGHVREFDGPGQTFTTQTAGSFALPDERQWELVSPPDKHGALIQPIGEGQVTQAAAAGNAFTFLTDAPTEAQPQGYSNFVQILAGRGAASWEPKDIAPPHGGATGVTTEGQEYRFFSPDLSASILQQVGPFTPLSEQATEQTAYLRNDTNGAYTPLVTPANDTAEPFQRFGAEGECPPFGNKPLCGPEFEGATPDLKHVVFSSKVALTPGANSGLTSLYEWSNGTLGLVSLLPGNGGSASFPALGFESAVARQAISADGSRVIWSETGGHLYMRDMTRGETVQLDAVQSGSTGSGSAAPTFQAASTDGSTAYFTDGQALTKSASSGAGRKGDLYKCEMVVEAGKLNCRLSDLTPAGAGGEPAGVLDLLPGVSEDGSRVYFVADGALAPGAIHGNLDFQGVPPGGLTNLYMWHAGVTTLVAVLSSEDYPDWNGRGSEHQLARVTSRVSGNGRWLTFMSQRELTGYDSRDAVTGRPDEEVYLYDAEHQRLVCASCDPSGARPAGVEFGKMAAGIDGGQNIWDGSQGLGGSVPAWTAFDAHGFALYQSRYLSNEGRLFFNSSDALVPADINATGDVYQYEPDGVPAGSHACSPSVGSGSDVYKPARGFEVEGRGGEEGAGCVGLISSGSSPQESGFLDASESGGDVFFFTSARLSPQDSDTSPDVYDAHECTTAAPCYPQAAAVQSPPCDTGDSCRAAATPQPSIFGAPASATFSGPGNPAPPPAVVKPTAAQLRAKKLTAALSSCRKRYKHSKKKRQTCEKQARKKYAKKATAKKSTRKGHR